MKIKLHHPLIVLFFYLFWFLGKLIPLKFINSLGSATGKIAFLFLKSKRKLVYENLKRAFPHWKESKIKECALENFKHYGITFFELFKIEKLVGKVEVEGIEHLEKKPAILITGHIGNWELMAQVLGRKGVPLFAMAKRSYMNIFTDFLIKLRKKGKVETILRSEENSPKLLLKAIKENKVLGFLIDQDTKADSLFVPFFSVPASTPKGPVEIAIKKNLSLVFGYLIRKGALKYFIKIERVDLSGIWIEDALKILNLKLEEVISKHPTQWVWVHRRWKSQPTSLNP